MKILSSANPRYIELTLLFILILVISLFSFSVAGLLALGFIWNWTLRFEIAKLETNKRYRFSTLKLVFTLDQIFQKPFARFPRVKPYLRILPVGVFWILVGWFLGSLSLWWTPFLGSIIYELSYLGLKKMMAPT